MTPLALGAAVAGAAFTAVWVASLRPRDVSLVDRFWGPGFALLAWVYVAACAATGPRAIAVATLASLWGLRLGWHLHLRNRGHGEDRRYAAMRARSPHTFAWTSLVTVFGLQAALQWVVAWPLWASAAQAAPWGALDAIAIAVWAVGFVFETVGDAQLAAFRRDPANRGRIMDRGLWAWTRHPNYFGDACVWWAFGVFGVAAGGPLWTLVGPVVMTILLAGVSGVPMLEAGMRDRPGWAEYAERTSAFVPLPPRRARPPRVT
jgi:steroid 5-alpha reductase family enzyme